MGRKIRSFSRINAGNRGKLRKGDLNLSKRLRGFLIPLLVVVVVAAGISVGKEVGAAGNDPGTQGDPLVARSYVDTKIAGILDRLTKIESDVADLKQKIAQTPAPATGGQTPTTPQVKRGTVSGSYVNIRTGAGTNYGLVTTVAKGTTAEVLSSQNNWYKIKLNNGTVGWIAGWLFSVQ
jgi:uncharacterized protein YgiM (DUF1202 family)